MQLTKVGISVSPRTRNKGMRNALTKLRRGNSTKAERRFAEFLKVERIPFKTKWLIQGREIDFLVGRYAIEIDAHAQDVEKNELLFSLGYIPIHIHSWSVGPHLRKWLKELWQQEQGYLPQSQHTRT